VQSDAAFAQDKMEREKAQPFPTLETDIRAIDFKG